MRYFLDTEFIESGPGKPITLLSIAIVSEDGLKELYLMNRDADLNTASDWVVKNVYPNLPVEFVPSKGFEWDDRSGNCQKLGRIQDSIQEFIGDDIPEFWGYYADYDWVVFCQIFGSMVDLPAKYPKFCRDLKQYAMDHGNIRLPVQLSTEHHAMNDARWMKVAFDYLTSIL